MESEYELQNRIVELLKIHYRDNKESQNNNAIPKVIKNANNEDLKRNWCDILNIINKDILKDKRLNISHIEIILGQLAKQTVTEIHDLLQIGTLPAYDYFQNKKPIYLKLFKGKEFEAHFDNPDAIYQIATETTFQTDNKLKSELRTDILLLINGLPIYNIELKKERSNIQKAVNQLKNYSEELFKRKIYDDAKHQVMYKFVQILVAMSENEMIYTPNQTDPQNISSKPSEWFNWTNKDNSKIHGYEQVVKTFFQIPLTHHLIARYTAANINNDQLMVLRSYQVHAIEAALKNVEEVIESQKEHQLNKIGYVWHTTGSGKTFTSFKLAQLLKRKYPDRRVVHVVDRRSLNQQTKFQFQKYANDDSSEDKYIIKISQPDNSKLLKRKLESKPDAEIIITSIQLIHEIKTIQAETEKFIFVFDEAHRSTDGEWFIQFKQNFKNAMVIGFTGTPILYEEDEESQKTLTQQIFGEEIHKYTMQEGIRDKKVLPFTIKLDYRKELLEFYGVLDSMKSKALEHQDNIEKFQCFLRDKTQFYKTYVQTSWNSIFSRNDFDNARQTFLSLLEENEQNNDLKQKLENKLESLGYFESDNYKKWIVEEIIADRQDNKTRIWSGIFATSSIEEAIWYYKQFQQDLAKSKSENKIKVSVLFDFSLSSDSANFEERTRFLNELLDKYNKDFNTAYNARDHLRDGTFKTDIEKRLAQDIKEENITKTIKDKGNSEQKLDLLIVVDQLLTGYDSKFVNTIYFDKEISQKYSIIQAISRTNRIYPNKNYGKVHFFKKPIQMKNNLEMALRMYANVTPDQFNGFIEEYKPKKLFAKILQEYNNLENIRQKLNIPEDYGKIPTNTMETEYQNLDQKTKDNITKFLESFNNLFNYRKKWYYLDQIERENFHQCPVISEKIEKTTWFDILKKRYRDLVNLIKQTSDPNKIDERSIINFEIFENNSNNIDSNFNMKVDENFLENLKKPLTKDKIIDILEKNQKWYEYNDQMIIKELIKEINDNIYVIENYNIFFSNIFEEISIYIDKYKNKKRENDINYFLELTGISAEDFQDYKDMDLSQKQILKYKYIFRLIKDKEHIDNLVKFCKVEFPDIKDIEKSNSAKIKCIRYFFEKKINNKQQ
ncbi:DEAD/DEAH box helicase family protein [Mycoplasma zalophi]|uniref:type I site-specific deoxyribonuclease n=1 Tax=Mycoplasma zalophi TaxID=191287 RepID=A0ABS6DQ84_9MOLU|nr:DEAD/DEAH box helicase family protein [Mycoplasma zalophi]MBU4692480.1 DEAD/DEAH box helicase family protein [Mycoplasma zalophi]